MEQEPYITDNPKATCGTASGNCAVHKGVDLEDGIWSYSQYSCIHTSCCFSIPNCQWMLKNLCSNAYELHVEWWMSWVSGSTVVNWLMKPPLNDHSCLNLECTDANFSGVDAMESLPYKVKDAKILLCQGTVVGPLVGVSSSFGQELVISSPGTRGPSDMLEQFTRLNWEHGGFMALGVTLILMSRQ